MNINDKDKKSLAFYGGTSVRKKPWPVWPRANKETEQVLIKVLHSGRWAISGAFKGAESYERQFAKAFSSYIGTSFCTPTTSGTGALTIALLALGVGPGDEVLVPGLTWVACASSVVCVGATPVLVDINLENLAMCPRQARRHIGKKTKAIILVHPFCRVADIDAFLTISNDFKIPIIEDCSQAHGARWRGKRVGSFGAVGCFSMQQSKTLTSGEGGATVTNDVEIYDRLEQLRCDGRRFTSDSERVINFLELIEKGTVLGQNLNLSEFQAAVLFDRLKHLDAENNIRRDQIERFKTEAREKNLSVIEFLPEQVLAENVCYNLVLRINRSRVNQVSVDQFCRLLSAELKSGVFPIYQPMNSHRLYCPLNSPRVKEIHGRLGNFDPGQFDLPNAVKAREMYFSIPHNIFLDDFAHLDLAKAIMKVSDILKVIPDIVNIEDVRAF